MDTLPLLYTYRRCPYAMRARMALLQAGVAFDAFEIVLRDKPAELMTLSPKGTVPVLRLHDGSVLEQSLDIMRWALQQHDPQAWLADVLANIADTPTSRLEQLLPWNWTPKTLSAQAA